VRRLAIVSVLAVALAACGGEDVAIGPTGETGASPSSPSPTRDSPSPTETPSGSPSPSARPFPPAWAMPIEDDVEPHELDDGELVPPGAELTDRVTLPAGGGLPDQVAVTYVIGDDPFAAEHGFAIWQRFADAPPWSVVFAFVDAPEEGVLGISVQTGELTGDGHDDVLAFEQTGGSGACGRWRVIAATPEGTDRLLQRRTCDTEILVADGALEMREAVYEPDDPHCCPSAFRFTTLEWDGERFAPTHVREEPTAS
jgi:hypothetical protein